VTTAIVSSWSVAANCYLPGHKLINYVSTCRICWPHTQTVLFVCL